MTQKTLNYKSDFTAILSLAGGWGVPFKAKFWTSTPSRSFTASWDGAKYTNCHKEADGRMCFGFDNHNMGTGKLMLELTFYLNNQCFADGICSEVISAFAPTFKDAQNNEYQLTLGYEGDSTITTIGTLPAFYQKGDRGDCGVYVGTGDMPEECNVQIDPTGEPDAFDNIVNRITAVENGKVDKITGKGLSTNDYTNDDKAKVSKIGVIEKGVSVSNVEIPTTYDVFIPEDGLDDETETVGSHYIDSTPHSVKRGDVVILKAISEMSAPYYIKILNSAGEVISESTAAVKWSHSWTATRDYDEIYFSTWNKYSAGLSYEIRHAGALKDIVDLKISVGNKVDKITGKGLSTNDYTNDDKAKVAAAATKDDVTGTTETLSSQEVGDLMMNDDKLLGYFGNYTTSKPIRTKLGDKVTFGKEGQSVIVYYCSSYAENVTAEMVCYEGATEISAKDGYYFIVHRGSGAETYFSFVPSSHHIGGLLDAKIAQLEARIAALEG